MMPIALAALLIGVVAGFVLARRVMLRMLAGLILTLLGFVFYVSMTPPAALPGDEYGTLLVAYLIAPPLSAGLFGGGVIAWLFRKRVNSA